MIGSGRTRDARVAVPDEQPASAGSAAATATEQPPVTLRIRWDDFCRVEADVHAVGHYQGVMPASAEKALDAAISGSDLARQIIAEHTRRHWFLGDFGHVNYFLPGSFRAEPRRPRA